MSRGQIVNDIWGVRRAYGGTLPPRDAVPQFLEDLIDLLFPQMGGPGAYADASDVDRAMTALGRRLEVLVGGHATGPGGSAAVVERFFERVPAVYATLWLDAAAIHEGDPASQSLDEVVAAYPGFFAIYTYRVAHELSRAGVSILPRLFTEYAHRRTGIDIHPGATIGERFCIDHGTGIVIGGTCEIGRSVKLYQGVSLGAMSVSKDMAGTKRHPTIEDNVVIYSNATILGGRTRIGHDSIIGGNVWLTESVPPYSIVQHRSDVKVRSKHVDDPAIDFVI